MDTPHYECLNKTQKCKINFYKSILKLSTYFQSVKVLYNTKFEKLRVLQGISKVKVSFTNCGSSSFSSCPSNHHHLSVLPKGTSFTASSGTKAAILPKGRSSTAKSGKKVAVFSD